MSVSGICFGSHTVTHPILTRVTKAQLKAELEESKAEIENRLGVRVEEFAYPNGQLGDYNPEVKAAIRESGYASAVTTRFGFNVAGSDPHELRRGQPWYADGDIFRLNFLLQRHGLVQ
jgi:peptidoglycan/xylan/chitin deacetylase (PgdA/CDA1 family)